MRISDKYLLHASPAEIWPYVFNPQTLMTLIPGCQKIEQTSPNEYRGEIQMGLPAIVGKYQTHVKILDYDQPHYCKFEGQVDGSTGSISGTALFKLKEVNWEETSLEYEGQAIISGALGKLSPRFIEGIAQTLIRQGLAKLDKQLQGTEVL